MTHETADLDSRWAALPRPNGPLLEADRVAQWAGGRILVALDADGRRHLLVAIPGDAPTSRIRPLLGLAVATRRMRIRGEEAVWLDIQLNEPRGIRAFTSLCSDIVEATVPAASADSTVIAAVIDRWRRFWSPVRDGLSPEDQLGLFGELWLMLEWVPSLSRVVVDAWRGPLGGRHDFVTSDISVEVKTTGISSGPIVHRITSLDQLAEPSEGQLYLLSVRAVDDPLGEHSLDDLIDRVRREVRSVGDDVADEVDERLAAYGWSPQDRGRYGQKLHVALEQLFAVEGTFPRLLSTSFVNGAPPAGVQDVTYTLDTGACNAWLVATSPLPENPLSGIA